MKIYFYKFLQWNIYFIEKFSSTLYVAIMLFKPLEDFDISTELF